MNSSLVMRPRLAIATALAIVLAVAVVAAFFPNASSYRSALSPIPDIPGYGQGIEPAFGRQFVAVDGTERGRPHDFPGRRPTLTFYLDGVVEIFSGCNYTGAKWRLRDGRIDPVAEGEGGWTMLPCEGALKDADVWMAEFLDRRLRWRLDGDTLQLSSGFGSMTLVDRGAGRDPDDLVGNGYQEWGSPKARGKSLILRPNSLWITFAHDGTIRANLGCDTVAAEVEINRGWMNVRDQLVPRQRADCSPSMKAQRTDWLWQFLREPLRWQSLDGWLILKAESMSLEFGYLDKQERRTNPADLSGLTFRSTDIIGGGAVRAGIEDGRGVTITVSADGTATAGVGCDRPTIRAEVRTGWLRFRGQSELSPDVCPNLNAERWLGDFLSDQPFWKPRSYGLVIRSKRTNMELMDEAEYHKLYGRN